LDDITTYIHPSPLSLVVEKAHLRFTSSGINGLDVLLEGKGFPAGSNIVVMGSPGSGKTTFGLQFLSYGCRNGENGVYVTLDERPDNVIRNAQRIGIDLRPFIVENALAVVDASPIRTIPGQVKIGNISIGRKEFSLTALVAAVVNHARDIDAKRIVVDSLTSFFLQYPRGAERRIAFMDFLEGIAPLECTSLFLTELRMSGLERVYQFEEFLADGVIIMRKYVKNSSIIRSIQVEKMRGVDHNVDAHPYRFGPGGIEVYPTEKVI
ncbi:MAG: ATPase domain-containing protein, partial [Candidatus Caldarchaeum sp.]